MRMVNCSGVINVRATALAVAKSCIIQKGHHFAHFTKTKAHINQCKSVQIYTTIIVTVHISVQKNGYCNSSIYYFSIYFSLLSVPLTLISTLSLISSQLSLSLISTLESSLIQGLDSFNLFDR